MKSPSSNFNIKNFLLILFPLVVFLLISMQTIEIVAEEGEGLHEGSGGGRGVGNGSGNNHNEDYDTGTIASILYAISLAYLAALFFFKYTRKLPAEKKPYVQIRVLVKDFFIKFRKILVWLHNFTGSIAFIPLLIHTIILTNHNSTLVVTGWIATIILGFYAFSGLIIWFKISPFWKNKKVKRFINRSHRNIWFMILIIALHVAHIIIAD